jgi:hypothetical protein
LPAKPGLEATDANDKSTLPDLGPVDDPFDNAVIGADRVPQLVVDVEVFMDHFSLFEL